MTIQRDRARRPTPLQEAEAEDLRDFFENSSVGMHWVAADGTIVRANRADFERLGYTVEEYVGQNIRRFYADPDVIGDILERLARGEIIQDEPARLLAKDGSIRHVRVDSSAVFRDGRVVQTRSMVRDDSARIRAEEALQANERSSAALADLLPLLLSYVDRERRYRYNNRAYEEWFGHSRADVLGRTMDEVLGDNAMRVLEPYVERALAGEHVTYETTVPYKDGGARAVRATYIPHRTANGIEGFVAIVEDITERVRATEAARYSEERYELATQATRDAVWDWDLRSGVTTWTPALTTAFGWAPETMRTEEPAWWYERVHPDERDAVLASMRAAIEGTGARWEEQYRFQHADGSWRIVHDRGSIVRDASSKAVRMVGAISDVTERRLAEQALRTSEERYRTLAEALPSYVGQFDNEGKASYFNDRWLELTGRSQEQLHGYGWTDVIHPDDLENMQRELRVAAAEGRQASFEYRVAAADGSWRWFLGRTAAVRGPDGVPVGWIGAGTDITDRKTTETALRESERRYRELVAAIDVAIYTTDARGRITHFNDAAVALWGRIPRIGVDQYCGSVRLYWPDGRPMAHENSPMALTLKHGRAVRGFESITERADGSRVHTIPYPTPLRDSAGKMVGAVNVLVDITERKRAERELYAAQAQWRALTEQNPSLIVLTDAEGRAVHFNPAWKEYFQRDESELRGFLWAELVNADDRDRLKDAWAAAWLAGETFSCEYRAQRHDGQDRWFRATMSPVRDSDGTITNWIAVSIDVHDEKTATEELRKSEARHRAILDTAVDGIITIDEQGTIESFNPAAERLFGYTADEMVGRNINTLMPQPTSGEHPDYLDHYLQTGERRVIGAGRDVEARRKDGTLIPLALSVSEVSVGGVRSFTGILHDLTDRKRAEDALRRSEERYRSLVSTMPALVVTTTPAGEFEEISESYEAYTGLTLDEARDWQTHQVIHPDDFGLAMRTWQVALESGEPMHNEMRLRRHDGVYRWHVTEGLPVRAPDGSIARWITVSVDVDDRRRAEEAEREQRALIDAMFHALPIGLTYVDREHRYVRVNEAFAEVNGLAPEEHEGRKLEEIAPERSSLLLPMLDRALSGESISDVEVSEETPEGEKGDRHWVAGFHPVQDSAGVVVGVAESFVEITERKRVEDALTYQFGLTSTITDNASVGLLMMDRDGRVTFLNAAGELITGYSFDDLRGKHAHDVLHYVHRDGTPYSVAECPIQQANATATMLSDYDDLFVRPDGSFYNVRCNIAPIIRDDVQIGALVEIRDVTYEKRSEARARFLAESSEALNTSLQLEHMLAGMAERAVPAVADIAVVGVFGGGPATVRFGTALADAQQRELVDQIHLRTWPAAAGDKRTIQDAMLAGETALIADAQAWVHAAAPNEQQRALAQRLGPRSVICAPLMVRGEAAGMMTFAVTRAGRSFDEADRLMVAELSRRAGLALENARLYSELQETAARERLLSEARRVLGESLDEDEQMTALPEVVVPDAADICVITRFESDGRAVVHFGPAGAQGDEPALVGKLRLRDWRLEGEDGSVSARLEQLRAVLVADAQTWIEYAAPDDAQKDAAQRLGVGSLIAAPITSRGQALGALVWLRRRVNKPYGDPDVRLAEEIARRTGTAIENARLYRAVQDAAGRARFLADARGLMSRTLDEQESLDALVGMLVPGMADWATVVSRDAGGRFQLRATRYADERYARFAALSTVAVDLSAVPDAVNAFEGRKSLLISELTDEAFETIVDPTLRALAKATPTRSALIVPVGTGEVIAMASMQPGRYKQADVDLMEEFAAHAAAALRNARLYGDLERTAGELERANAAKDEFLGLVSHELKTPITTIYGNAEVLERRARDIEPELQKTALSDIRTESERLHRIVDNLLVLARLEQGQQIEAEPILVRRVVKRVMDEHGRRFPRRKIELRHAEELIPALASPQYTEQIVRNLLSNAEKYSPPETTIEVHIERVGDEVHVRVLDRGQGILEQEVENVFTPFYRSPMNTPAAPGAGIGLAVCKRLAEAQSGTIWARQREGGGSEFGFALPMADEDED